MSFIVAGGALLLALLAGISSSTIAGGGQKRDATSPLMRGDRIPASSVIRVISRPLTASHSRTVWSDEAVTTRPPSAENDALMARHPLPPVRIFHGYAAASKSLPTCEGWG